MIGSRLALSSFAGVCLLGFWSSPVQAQASEQTVPTVPTVPATAVDDAERLFRTAVELMESGNFVEACPKLEQSHRLDPGGGTVLNLGYCLEKLGKLVAAYSAYEEAARRAKDDGREDRETNARTRLAMLESRLAYVQLNIAPAVSELPKLEVRLDGKLLTAAEYGSKFPVDAGAHLLRATAPDRLPFERNIEVPNEPTTLEIAIEQLIRPSLPVEQPAKVSPKPDLSGAKRAEPESNTALWIAGATTAGLLAGVATTGTIAWLKTKDGAPPTNGWAVATDIELGAAAIAAGITAYLWLSKPAAAKRASANVQFLPASATVRF